MGLHLQIDSKTVEFNLPSKEQPDQLKKPLKLILSRPKQQALNQALGSSQPFAWRRCTVQPNGRPMNALEFNVPSERKVIHKQQIIIAKQACYDIELSWTNIKFFIVIKRRFIFQESETLPTLVRNIDVANVKPKLFVKTLYVR